MKQPNLSSNPIIVIFEVKPTQEGKATYLEMANLLKEELKNAEGFISGERYESLSEPGKLLSINIWKDEESLTQWRNNRAHRKCQKAGHTTLFEKYTIKVARLLREYSDKDREQAPNDSNEQIIKK
jgi:heme-degrading monooxygenase HmoA